MTRIIIVLLLTFMGATSLSAQEPATIQPQQEQVKLKKKERIKKEKKKEKKTKKQKNDDAQLPTDESDVVPAIPQPPPIQTRQRDEYVMELEAQLAERDQTLVDLRRQLDEALQREQDLQKRVKEGDITTLFLVNVYLEKPYNEKVAADAQRRLAAITTPSLDADRKQIQILFDHYAQYYQEVLALLREAGQNVQMESPRSANETAQQYIRRLQQTEYYRNCYKKNFYIPFLENIIDEAIRRLRAHNPQSGRLAKFSDLFPTTKP